jgi:hypothetical protein
MVRCGSHDNPRNGRPEIKISLFALEALGQLGNAKRRFFHGPGMNNFDMTLSKSTGLTESKSLDFHIEASNVFNHAQFYGPSSVDGEINDPQFGHIVSAQPTRLIQLAVKFYF